MATDGGTATVLEQPNAKIRTDGPCLEDTLRALASSGRGIDTARVRADAIDLLGTVIASYAKDVAPGEVGADGSQRAGPKPPNRRCTGLLYGRVQSGKTMAMIGFVAAAMDNGFRVVVVLTSDNTTLAAQTTDRFRAALEPHGPITRDALAPGEWETDHEHIRKHLGSAGVVFICSKNRSRLDKLEEFLTRIGAPDYPAVILDDEADQATPDNNVAKRGRKKRKNEETGHKEELPAPTAIYSAVVDSLGKTLRHHVFLQVTATPYALLLQTVGEVLRPSFARLLEPGAGYTGGAVFFDEGTITDEPGDRLRAPLAEVAESESDDLAAGVSEAPQGLRNALNFFLVAASAQVLLDPDAVRAGQNFLCHTSQLREQHRNLERIIKEYVASVETAIDRGQVDSGSVRLDHAHRELLKTCPGAPSLDSIVASLKRRLVGRKVIVVNSETDAVFGRSLNLIVGGNILGRGVTIENLLVTYYLRTPKLGQMDTMLQHARMYGYRGRLMPYTRVFLPLELALRFREIHQMEQRLRQYIASERNLEKPIPIDRGANLKVTRAGVLDPNYIDLFEAEDQRYPSHPEMWLAPGEYESIKSRVEGLLGRALPREMDPRAPKEIDFATLLDLVRTFPYRRVDSSIGWIPTALTRVLEQQHARAPGQRAWLYVREMNRRVTQLSTGALSGTEIERLQTQAGPVFCAFWDRAKSVIVAAGQPEARPYWYPTLLFDASMPRVVVNVSPT